MRLYLLIFSMFILLCSLAYAENISSCVNTDGTIRAGCIINEEGMYVLIQPEQNVTEITFFDRLKNKTKINNSICDDAEYPFIDDDCELTSNIIICKEDRCIFEEIWFAKLMLLLLAIMLILYKKDYNVFLLIIGVILLFNFSSLDIGLEDIKLGDDVIPSGKIQFTEAARESNVILKIGGIVWKSNPLWGFFAALLIVYLIYRFLLARGSRR